MSQYKSFETERLFIRPTEEEDASFILELFNTPTWIQNIGKRDVNNIEEARKYIIDKMIPQLIKLGYSNYTLIRKTDQVKIGTCGLYDREGLDGIDIGFALLPDFEGKGYGFESAARVRDAAFNDFGIKTILAITSKENISSQKLIKKLGLELIGTTRIPNDDEELLTYKLKSSLKSQSPLKALKS